MSDIFREVDEALQQEKVARLWKEYAPTIIAAAIILIATVAITTGYKSWNQKRNAEETARLVEAVNSKSLVQNVSNFSGDTRKNHATFGQLIMANKHIEDKEFESATKLYTEIAQNKKAPKDIKNLARILTVQANAHLATDKQLSSEKQLALLAPVLKDKKDPWIWHARIEAAAIHADVDKDYASAITLLNEFEDVKYIPLSLKNRAKALAHIYQIKAATAEPAVKKETK